MVKEEKEKVMKETRTLRKSAENLCPICGNEAQIYTQGNSDPTKCQYIAIDNAEDYYVLTCRSTEA